MTLKNSCDGCLAGMPIVNGIHINEKVKTIWGRNHMSCSEWRYIEGASKPVIKVIPFNFKAR